MWGFAIANYVWWIGMGMAGTFISAALLLLRQDWRASVNRFAEAMTVFAVSVSGLFPILPSRPSVVFLLGRSLPQRDGHYGRNGAVR